MARKLPWQDDLIINGGSKGGGGTRKKNKRDLELGKGEWGEWTMIKIRYGNQSTLSLSTSSAILLFSPFLLSVFHSPAIHSIEMCRAAEDLTLTVSIE